MYFSKILPSLSECEEGEVGQTGTPRSLVFYGRHILDIPMDENTCDIGAPFSGENSVICLLFGNGEG